jgi:hypothetical protein
LASSISLMLPCNFISSTFFFPKISTKNISHVKTRRNPPTLSHNAPLFLSTS